MNSKELFSMALGLQHPWKLNNVDFVTEEGEKVLRIDIGFEKGAKFSDPDSREPCPVHDTMERRWRLSAVWSPIFQTHRLPLTAST